MIEDLVGLFRRQARYKLDQLVDCAHGGTPFWMGELSFAKLLYNSKIRTVYTVWDIHTFLIITSCITDTFRAMAFPNPKGNVHKKFTISQAESRQQQTILEQMCDYVREYTRQSVPYTGPIICNTKRKDMVL